MSGAIFEPDRLLPRAFLNGIAFNLLNLTIVLWLLCRATGPKGAGDGVAIRT